MPSGRVLFSPFRAGTAHVMEFWPVRVEEIRPQRRPRARRHPGIVRRMPGGKQHSQDVRFPKCPHSDPLFTEPLPPIWLRRRRQRSRSILRRLIACEMLVCPLFAIVSMNLSGI